MRPLIVATLIALTVFGLIGCARISRPEKNLSERLAYDAQVKARYQLDPEWWKVYDDARLNEAVELALARNLDLAKAAVSVTRAFHQAGLAGLDLFPKLSGGLDASSRRNIDAGGPSARSAGGSLSLSYELDLWRKVAASAGAAEWEYKATVEDLENARLALVNSVVDAYYNLAYLGDAIESSRKNLANLRAVENTVTVKYENGKVAALEKAQARQSVLSAENSLNDLETQHKNAEQTLRDLLNLKPGQPLAGASGAAFSGRPTLAGLRLPGLDLNVPLAVLANRPDLRAAEFRLEKALKNVAIAEKGWLPSISLSSALTSSANAVSAAFNNPAASAGLSVSLPFLDWSRVLNNLRISETDFETARLGFEQSLTTALNEVDAYYYAYGQALRGLDNARRKHAEDLRISAYQQDRYENGAAELSDWLSAVNTVYSSRLAALNALYQALRYENMTYKAMAGRWQTSP
ncbi:MAG: TolC family protein [Candidatus Adiutrix sp.]|jgi:outer membrane protein TolC|nr:TolC family protein [Candidatus Adiutrix sp.]